MKKRGSRHLTSDDKGTTHTYDAQNRLSSNAGQRFYYDAAGRLDRVDAEGVLFDYVGVRLLTEHAIPQG